MAEREVEVTGHAADGLRLRLLGSACEGCAGGCAGRCNLFATGNDGEFRMATPEGQAFATGDRLRLRLDDEALRRAAWQGYGLALFGLLLGAGVGRLIGGWLGQAVDAMTLAGLLAGTFLAVVFSKRHLPEPSLLPVGCAPIPPLHE